MHEADKAYLAPQLMRSVGRTKGGEAMWISWKHEDTDFSQPMTFDQKVEVFYEQTLGWQLHIANLIANGGTTFNEFKRGIPGYRVKGIRHSGFAVVHICLSYFETIGQCVWTGGSRACFEAGVREVFPSLATEDSALVDGLVEELYDNARCGLYHSSRTRAGVGLGQPSDGSALAYDPVHRVLVLSPERLPSALVEHLESFRSKLLDSTNLDARAAFEQWFDREASFGSGRPAKP